MYQEKHRFGQDPAVCVRSSQATFRKPLKWQREVEDGTRSGKDCLVFTCSWSDWFIQDADTWRNDAWEIIRQTPGLTYQILTKRPERIQDHLPAFWDEIKDRVWLITSVENQEIADLRLPFLYRVTPRPIVVGVSYEPALGPVDFNWIGASAAYTGCADDNPFMMGFIDWIIIGGESGPDARPFNIQWARMTISECRKAGVACFVKQLGRHPYKSADYVGDIGYGLKLNDPKGGDMDEWPQDLRVRQYPEVCR